MIKGWRTASIGELGQVVTGTTPSTANNGYYGGDIPFIAPGDLGKSLFVSKAGRTLTPNGLEHAKAVPAGSILFTCIGATIGKASIAGRVLATNQQIKSIVCAPKRADNIFVYYLLALRAEQIKSLACAQAIPIINKTSLEEVTAPIPSLPEQRKIAAILRTWDEAIDKLQALARAQRKKQSQAANALLFDKKHDHRKKSGKRLQQLADVTRELTQRNNGLNLGREFVMGVSNSKGIVPMREQSIGGDLSRYKVLPPRAFAYNPMRINVGSIAMSRLDSCVLVSPDYVLFQCVDDRLDPDYLDHLCNTHWWSHHINAGGSGSVRMRTYYDDLAALRLELPDLEEQKKISSYLNAARRENNLIVDQINALQRQKRGLMQKLLTGEWRVKC